MGKIKEVIIKIVFTCVESNQYEFKKRQLLILKFLLLFHKIEKLLAICWVKINEKHPHVLNLMFISCE
jgi:hypothetical protein